VLRLNRTDFPSPWEIFACKQKKLIDIITGSNEDRFECLTSVAPLDILDFVLQHSTDENNFSIRVLITSNGIQHE